MKDSYQRLLDDVRTTLLAPSEQGISPDQVKQVIIYILSPYFLNHSVLEEAAIPVLAPEAVNISRISEDAWAKQMLVFVLEDYHKAVKIDKAACLAGCVRWHNQILHGVSSEFVSVLNLNHKLDELSLEDFKYEAFRTIGTLIEASIQPYLKELLLQIRISKGKSNPDQGLEAMNLGVAVNELCKHSGYEELFAPLPWKIRLNQWRNMAQHHKTRIEKGQIIGIYGTNNNEHKVTLTREELLNTLKTVYLILSVMKGARSIFFIDHLDEMRPYFPDTSSEARADIKIFYMASSFATQGFDLKNVSTDEESITVILQDVTPPPLNEQITDYERMRIIHSSQFIYVIWSYFPLDTIAIEHLDKQGDLRCTIKGKGTDCEAIASGDMPFEELARKVVITLAN